MQVSINAAKAHLADLVRRAQAGEDIVITRRGRPAVRLVAAQPADDPAERRCVMETAQARAARTAIEGPTAARSQDFLCDGHGLPK